MQKEIHFDESGRNPDEVFKKLGFAPKISGQHIYWDKDTPNAYIMVERSRTPFMYPHGVPVCADYVATISAYDKKSLEIEEKSLDSNLRPNFRIRSKKEY